MRDAGPGVDPEQEAVDILPGLGWVDNPVAEKLIDQPNTVLLAEPPLRCCARSSHVRSIADASALFRRDRGPYVTAARSAVPVLRDRRAVDRTDFGDYGGRGLVFPEPKDEPSGFGQREIVAPVAFLVAGDLRAPVVRIPHSRSLAMVGAAVPETALDEDGDAGTREDDVRTDGSASFEADREVDAEAHPRSVQKRANLTLWTRIPATIRAHVRTPRGRAGRRWNDNRHRLRILDVYGVEMAAMRRTAADSQRPLARS